MRKDVIGPLVRSFKDIPVIDKDGYQYFVHPLSDGIPSIDGVLLDAAVEGFMELLPPLESFDLFITAEAMGIPIAAALSMRTKKPFSIVRKKRYGLPGEITVRQRTGYSKGELHIDLPQRTGRAVIVDDVLSTGGTIKAVTEGVLKAGWTIPCAIVLVDKTDGNIGRMETELGYPIRAILKVSVEDGVCRVEASG